MSAYQWYNFLNARVPSRATPLNINKDETGIRLIQVAGAGNVVVTTVRLRGNGLRPVQNMSLSLIHI